MKKRKKVADSLRDYDWWEDLFEDSPLTAFEDIFGASCCDWKDICEIIADYIAPEENQTFDYCPYCGRKYRKDSSIPREFDCKYCGKHVVVTNPKDRRRVYCSSHCEKQYWRKASKNQLHKDIAKGHVTHLNREHYENRREEGL